MDQIVFVFDLEQVVPLEKLVKKLALDESLIEARLNNFKQAVLRIATFCSDASKISEGRRDLPSLGFRFYSSTDYFSVPPQLTGNWHDLSLSSWEAMEDSLEDRFDSILASVQRTKPGDSLVGRKTQAAALCKVLEEVSVLYSWDRPALHSPVKKGRDAEPKLGNAVVVVTRLPEDWKDLDRFLGAGARRKKPTVKEVVDTFTSKRIKRQFTEELNIALHILDTGEGMGGEKGELVQLFNRALKEMRGGVLPSSSLITLFSTKVDTDNQCSILVCSSRSMQRMSSSAAVQAHLAEVVIPSKVLDKSYMQEEVKMGDSVLSVEFVKCGVELSDLESKGFIRHTFFQPGQKWKESFSVWSDKSPAFCSVLLYLQHSGQCLVMVNKKIMAVMFYQTDYSGFFCIMDKLESHFYHQLLRLDSHTPIITLTEEIEVLLTDIRTLQLRKIKESMHFQHLFKKKSVFTTKPVEFDMSILDSWRLPDIPAPQFMTGLKAATTSLTCKNSPYHKLMLGVRESYIRKGVMKGEKMKFDNEARVTPGSSSKPDATAGKLEEKLLTMSISTTPKSRIGSSGARERIDLDLDLDLDLDARNEKMKQNDRTSEQLFLERKKKLAEDDYNQRGKEVKNMESKISDLKKELSKMEENKLELVNEHDLCEMWIKEVDSKRIKLEQAIEKQQIEDEKEVVKKKVTIENLKIKMSEVLTKIENLPNEHLIPSVVDNPNKVLKEFIEKQIVTKEKELECPVCLVIASSPILTCSEQHLICSNCRLKTEHCPVCSRSYHGKIKRHRYAEEALQEVKRLKSELEGQKDIVVYRNLK